MRQTDKAKMSGMDRPTPEAADERTPTTPLRESTALEDADLIERTQAMLDRESGHEHATIRTARRNPALEAEEEDEENLNEDEDVEDDELDDDQEDDLDSSNDDSDGEGEDEEADEEKDTPNGLPDALVRSAVAFKWGTKEDVIRYYQEDPQRALEVFNNIYRARLEASNQFSAIGKANRLKQQTDNAPTVKKVTPEQIAKLKETFGDEATPLLEVIETQQEMLEQLVSNQGPSQTRPETRREPDGMAEQGLVDQQINNFFSADDMKPWQKVYGKLEFGHDWEDLSPSQQRYRHRVLVKANDILGGAQLHGRQVGLPEALEEAHLVVTQQFRDDVLVNNIKKNAVKRHKAISVKPSQSKTKKSRSSSSEFGVPGQRTPEQARRAVEAKMKKIGL